MTRARTRMLIGLVAVALTAYAGALAGFPFLGGLAAMTLGVALALLGSRRIARLGRAATTLLERPEVGPRVARWELDEIETALHRLSADRASLRRHLQDERGFWGTLVDAGVGGVVALAESGEIRYANRAARELLGLAETAVGGAFGSVVRDPDLRALAAAGLGGRAGSRDLAIGGRVVVASANPVVEEEGGLAGGVVLSLRDVTELRRVEGVRRDFVANASHELKTPLTVVRGFAESLMEEDPPPELRRHFLRSIYQQSVRLQAIVDDLLDLSRFESGGWVPEPEELMLGAVVAESWDTVRSARGAGLPSFEVLGDAQVRADPAAVRHVLRNLLDNAARHTPVAGHVRVEIDGGGDTVAIRVVDDGDGIPSEALPRIFERFYRVDPARSRAEGGTGLGLAIVSHLARQMGGSVTARSRLGSGTTIEWTLPVGVADGRSEPSVPALPEAVDSPG